ncbi:MAG TPA: DUF2891 domain-containing protein [Candidatus Eremiobacteraceae bacterium]
MNAALLLRSARLALACIVREFPVGTAHIVRSRRDERTHRELHPAFYGCFDWHSAVENHWQLVRIARLYPDVPLVNRIRRVLSIHLMPAATGREAVYLTSPGRAGFERPYGLAWILQLAAELHAWDTELARRLYAAMRPLHEAAVASIAAWLPKVSHPIRSGVHAQSAFAMGLALDYAREVGNLNFSRLLETTALRFYAHDHNVPIAYEPSGHDFLSPSLGEADLMRRVLSPKKFATWLSRFLPGRITLQPVEVSDPRDGHLAHFAGLNMSRAWMLDGIASGLPKDDLRVKRLRSLGQKHRKAGLKSLALRGYMTTHWLGAYAVYLLTRGALHWYDPARRS